MVEARDSHSRHDQSSHDEYRRFLTLIQRTPQNRLLLKALRDADLAHAGQKRRTGEPYIIHPIGTATILIEEHQILDPDIGAGALLHDAGEDTSWYGDYKSLPYSIWKHKAHSMLTQDFNHRVADYVVTLTKPRVDGIEYFTEQQADAAYYAQLDADKTPSGAILIKMADRLHNLRTLDVDNGERRNAKLHETRDIYVPIFTRAIERKVTVGDYKVAGEKLLEEIKQYVIGI
jgi:GTP diphosphokinase / guanosine-3',5'-bis(diphosphate) 3'-diphosphatase